jgi:hypothetical protein
MHRANEGECKPLAALAGRAKNPRPKHGEKLAIRNGIHQHPHEKFSTTRDAAAGHHYNIYKHTA